MGRANVAAGYLLPLVEDIESKIDKTVITGISAIESKLDALDLGDIGTMLSAIESKIDGTTGIMDAISAVESKLDILDLGAVDNMLSAIESKIDGTTGIMDAISAIESKLDILDLGAVDNMLSAIESKIEGTTGIMNALSAIESKLDILDLGAVDEFLSAIESKIDGATGLSAMSLDIQTMLSAIESKIEGTTGIMQAISVVDLEVSLIESKLDAGGSFRSNYFLEDSSALADLSPAGKTTCTTLYEEVFASDISIKAFTISVVAGGYTGEMYYRVLADLAPAVIKRFPFASSEILPTDDYEMIMDEMIYVHAGESVIIQICHIGSPGASDIGNASACVSSFKYMEWH